MSTSMLIDDFAQGMFNVVQSDTVNIPDAPVGLQVTTTGAVRVLTTDGDDCTVQVPEAGFYLPATIQRVFDTGTDVTNAHLLAIRLRDK